MDGQTNKQMNKKMSEYWTCACICAMNRPTQHDHMHIVYTFRTKFIQFKYSTHRHYVMRRQIQRARDFLLYFYGKFICVFAYGVFKNQIKRIIEKTIIIIIKNALIVAEKLSCYS